MVSADGVISFEAGRHLIYHSVRMNRMVNHSAVGDSRLRPAHQRDRLNVQLISSLGNADDLGQCSLPYEMRAREHAVVPVCDLGITLYAKGCNPRRRGVSCAGRAQRLERKRCDYDWQYLDKHHFTKENRSLSWIPPSKKMLVIPCALKERTASFIRGPWYELGCIRYGVSGVQPARALARRRNTGQNVCRRF